MEYLEVTGLRKLAGDLLSGYKSFAESISSVSRALVMGAMLTTCAADETPVAAQALIAETGPASSSDQNAPVTGSFYEPVTDPLLKTMPEFCLSSSVGWDCYLRELQRLAKLGSVIETKSLSIRSMPPLFGHSFCHSSGHSIEAGDLMDLIVLPAGNAYLYLSHDYRPSFLLREIYRQSRQDELVRVANIPSESEGTASESIFYEFIKITWSGDQLLAHRYVIFSDQDLAYLHDGDGFDFFEFDDLGLMDFDEDLDQIKKLCIQGKEALDYKSNLSNLAHLNSDRLDRLKRPVFLNVADVELYQERLDGFFAKVKQQVAKDGHDFEGQDKHWVNMDGNQHFTHELAEGFARIANVYNLSSNDVLAIIQSMFDGIEKVVWGSKNDSSIDGQYRSDLKAFVVRGEAGKLAPVAMHEMFHSRFKGNCAYLEEGTTDMLMHIAFPDYDIIYYPRAALIARSLRLDEIALKDIDKFEIVNEARPFKDKIGKDVKFCGTSNHVALDPLIKNLADNLGIKEPSDDFYAMFQSPAWLDSSNCGFPHLYEKYMAHLEIVLRQNGVSWLEFIAFVAPPSDVLLKKWIDASHYEGEFFKNWIIASRAKARELHPALKDLDFFSLQKSLVDHVSAVASFYSSLTSLNELSE